MTITRYGYSQVWINGKSYLEHILIVESIFGKSLPKGAKIHHIDGNKLNNKPENLLVCPDQAYHVLIHRRQKALEECGHADWRKCRYCKKYDDPCNDMYTKHGTHSVHRECARLKRKNKIKAGVAS